MGETEESDTSSAEEKLKKAKWRQKMNRARAMASHYNARMMVRAHRWEFADGTVEYEYTIQQRGNPRRCWDGRPQQDYAKRSGR